MHHITSSLVDDHGIRTRDFQTKHYTTVMARVNEKSITEYVKSNEKMETKKEIQITHSATVVTNIDKNRKLIDKNSKHTLSNRQVNVKALDQSTATADINNIIFDIDIQLASPSVRKVINGKAINAKSIIEYVHSNLKIETKKDAHHHKPTKFIAIVINIPLSLANDISTCRTNIFNEQRPIQYSIILNIAIDSKKGQQHYHTNKKNSTASKNKHFKTKHMFKYFAVSYQTITSLTLRKRIKHNIVPNGTSAHINMHSHSNMIRDIHRMSIVKQQQQQQQQVKKQIDQQQPLHIRISISKNGEENNNDVKSKTLNAIKHDQSNSNFYCCTFKLIKSLDVGYTICKCRQNIFSYPSSQLIASQINKNLICNQFNTRSNLTETTTSITLRKTFTYAIVPNSSSNNDNMNNNSVMQRNINELSTVSQPQQAQQHINQQQSIVSTIVQQLRTSISYNVERNDNDVKSRTPNDIMHV